jgi:hypothetical protein
MKNNNLTKGQNNRFGFGSVKKKRKKKKNSTSAVKKRTIRIEMTNFFRHIFLLNNSQTVLNDTNIFNT